MAKRRFVMLVLAVTFCGAALAAPKTPEDEIMQADRDFCKATAEHRAEGWTSFFAEKAVASVGNPVVGKEAIRAYYEKVFSDASFQLKWDPVKAEVFKAGDLGYTVGRFVSTRVNAKGETITRTGTYLTVWAKQGDGTWKVIADGGTADPLPAAGGQK